MFFTEPERKKMVIVQSGRDKIGYHAYFKTDEPMYKTFSFHHPEQPNAITVKGSGLVVAPPSTHNSGRQYRFIQQPDEIPLLYGDVEEELKRRALAAGLTSESVGGLDVSDILKGVQQGGQDNAIMYLAYYLRRQGASYEEAYTILSKWREACRPVIPDNEIVEKLTNHYDRSEPYSFYYVTDPNIFKITKELRLINDGKVEARVVAELINIDDNNHQKIDINALCDYLDREYNFKGPNDISELLIYKDGIYIDGARELDVILERLFGALANINFKAEIRRHMRDRNQIERAHINVCSDKIVVENGILDIKLHHLEPFTPAFVASTKIPVAYNPDADAYEFETVIEEILDKEDIPVMQELFGYCLVMSYKAGVSFWFLGEGGNGKSTVIEVLESMLGLNNVTRLSLSQFTSHTNFDIVNLYGSLANISQEPRVKDNLETNVLKAITGNDYIQGNIKYEQGAKRFKNTAKLIVVANSLPKIEDESYGFWSRVLPIPFPNTFRRVDGEIIGLGEKLSTPENLSGILNWALEGLDRLMANNFKFSTSQTQQAMKTEMMLEANPIKAFTNQWLIIKRKGSMGLHDAVDAYNLFAHLYGVNDKTASGFSKAIQQEKLISTKRKNHGKTSVLTGCSLSKDLIALYGWYQNRPLKPNEIGNIEILEEVEVRACSLIDYLMEYPEPVDEVQEPISGKMCIFHSEELIALYKRQLKTGAVQYRGPGEIGPTNSICTDKVSFTSPSAPSSSSASSSPSEEAPTEILKKLNCIEQASCEKCGKYCFATYQLTESDGVESMICTQCANQIKEDNQKNK
jgi:putative DNA primase/helicase